MDFSFYLNSLKRLFGFTHSGASVAGRFVRKALSRREIRRIVGATLVAVLTFFFLVHSFANMGGSVLALNLTGATPSGVIDASTKYTVQSPIEFTYESRGFSWYHAGADLVAPTGTPVKPIMEGEIEATNYDYFGYGIHVIIRHADNYESVYGHLSKINVKVGDSVDLNTVLGLSGSTGFSTGPHLHLEVHKDGIPVNPADIVPGVK